MGPGSKKAEYTAYQAKAYQGQESFDSELACGQRDGTEGIRRLDKRPG
jgi:hypothetical protein